MSLATVLVSAKLSHFYLPMRQPECQHRIAAYYNG